VQSVKQECLDHFVVFGEAHLRHLVTQYADYYNRPRPYQALGNRPPDDEPAAVAAAGAVVCAERLGGLLRHYQRRAA
jgi:putative transposase